MSQSPFAFDAAGFLDNETYWQLRVVAARMLRSETNARDLDPCDLVNEASLRLASLEWRNRQQLLAVYTVTMRRVLLDFARYRNAAKRARMFTVPLNEACQPATQPSVRYVEVSQALERMQPKYPRQTVALVMRVVEGFSNTQIADSFRITTRTVKRDLRAARQRLADELGLAIARDADCL